jgi:NAD(P)-dependent dehydrogenase (short-subunit alcohol dehydrogenase family)
MWTLVTGGAKRLGAALCLALAEKGHSIVVHYRHSHKEALQVVAHCQAWGREAAAIQGDFSTLANVQDFVERYLQQFSETSTLINNVGDYFIRSALQTSIEDWISLFQINLHTPFILTQALAPSLIRNHGQIVNIGVSGLYRHAANTYATAYTLTKQGLWGLTLAAARELAPQGVRVNMVSPGQLDISVDRHPIPMHRSATCWEVCRVVNFLLDPESAYITGQNIEVAGGLGLA